MSIGMSVHNQLIDQRHPAWYWRQCALIFFDVSFKHLLQNTQRCRMSLFGAESRLSPSEGKNKTHDDMCHQPIHTQAHDDVTYAWSTSPWSCIAAYFPSSVTIVFNYIHHKYQFGRMHELSF